MVAVKKITAYLTCSRQKFDLQLFANGLMCFQPILDKHLQVAKLAGLPKPVLNIARNKLAELEAGSSDTANLPPLAVQNELFASAPDPILEALTNTDLADITPKQALDLLYSWQTKVKSL